MSTQATHDNDDMPVEIDFSGAKRGQFYRTETQVSHVSHGVMSVMVSVMVSSHAAVMSSHGEQSWGQVFHQVMGSGLSLSCRGVKHVTGS